MELLEMQVLPIISRTPLILMSLIIDLWKKELRPPIAQMILKIDLELKLS